MSVVEESRNKLYLATKKDFASNLQSLFFVVILLIFRRFVQYVLRLFFQLAFKAFVVDKARIAVNVLRRVGYYRLKQAYSYFAVRLYPFG